MLRQSPSNILVMVLDLGGRLDSTAVLGEAAASLSTVAMRLIFAGAPQ